MKLFLYFLGIGKLSAGLHRLLLLLLQPGVSGPGREVGGLRSHGRGRAVRASPGRTPQEESEPSVQHTEGQDGPVQDTSRLGVHQELSPPLRGQSHVELDDGEGQQFDLRDQSRLSGPSWTAAWVWRMWWRLTPSWSRILTMARLSSSLMIFNDESMNSWQKIKILLTTQTVDGRQHLFISFHFILFHLFHQEEHGVDVLTVKPVRTWTVAGASTGTCTEFIHVGL